MLDIFGRSAIVRGMTRIIAILPYIQIVLAILMVGAILLQKSDSSAGGAFGASDNWNAAYHSRRGFEKFSFNATILLAILFAAVSFMALLYR